MDRRAQDWYDTGKVEGQQDGFRSALQLILSERLSEPNPDSEGDEAYDLAVLHCCNAIQRALGEDEWAELPPQETPTDGS